MDYKLLSVDDMKISLENRLRGLEASHFSVECALKEYRHLGDEYDEFADLEVGKMLELEKLIAFLRTSLSNL